MPVGGAAGGAWRSAALPLAPSWEAPSHGPIRDMATATRLTATVATATRLTAMAAMAIQLTAMAAMAIRLTATGTHGLITATATTGGSRATF